MFTGSGTLYARTKPPRTFIMSFGTLCHDPFLDILPLYASFKERQPTLPSPYIEGFFPPPPSNSPFRGVCPSLSRQPYGLVPDIPKPTAIPISLSSPGYIFPPPLSFTHEELKVLRQGCHATWRSPLPHYLPCTSFKPLSPSPLHVKYIPLCGPI